MVIAYIIKPKGMSDDFNAFRIGTWCESEYNDKKCDTTVQFFHDGTFEAKGIDLADDIKYEFRGTWRSRGHEFCTEIIDSKWIRLSDGVEVNYGVIEPFCDLVIDINKNEYIYISNFSGKKEIMYRVD